MKTSEFIKVLQHAVDQFGDLEVIVTKGLEPAIYVYKRQKLCITWSEPNDEQVDNRLKRT